MDIETKFRKTFIIMLFPLLLTIILCFFPKIFLFTILFYIFAIISLGLAIKLYYLNKIIEKHKKEKENQITN